MAKGLFSSAATIKAPVAKGRKAEVASIEMPGMERFAAIKAAIDTLTALAGVEEAALKGLMADRFINVGTTAQARPDNFKGLDGAAEGSCQLKVRSTASVLSEDDQKLLATHEIPFGSITKTEEAFLINPIYTNDMALLAKVEEALENVDLPDNFLMKQEKVSVSIVTEESLTAVFKKTPDVAEVLLPVVSTMAIRPKIDGDFWAILDSVMTPIVEAA